MTDCDRHRIETLYENNRFGWIGLLLLGSVTLYITAANLSALPYLLLMGAGIWLYINNLNAYRRALKRADFQPTRWARSMMLVSALNGLLLSAIIYNHLDLNQHSHVYLVATIFVMSMYGSSIVAAPCKSVHIAWTLASMLPLSLWLTIAGDAELKILGLMLLTAGIPVSFLLNHYYYEMNEKSFRLRMENLDLIKQVSAAKERAEQANREKSNFLTATNHDLRQPLHALDLFLGALSNTTIDQEQQMLVAKAQQSSRSLAELLNALLEIAQLDSGSLVPHRTRFDLGQLMREIAAEFKPQLLGITLQTQLPAGLAIDSDRLLLARIVRNLISNAIKHSRAQRIELALCPAQEKIHIDIRDNGIGIPMAEQQEIFSEFYQLNNSERDRSKGLGLGLAIVKRLVTLLEGRVQLYSEQSKGCHFRITLPYAEQAPLSLSEGGEREKPYNINADISGLFILLIEDNHDVREATRQLLKQWHCELLAGESLSAIEKELDTHPYPPPDILLIDYRLRQDRTGLEAIEQLQRRFGHSVPSIMVTGERNPDTLHRIEEAGCKVLRKPVSAESLKQALATLSTPIDP